MIERYTNPEMARIWEPQNRYKIWLEIEMLALEGWAGLGVVSKDLVRAIRSKAKFNIERIDQLERELKHDVIAFLTSVAEFVGPDSRFIHRGLTSSDVVDTSFAVQLVQAGQLLLKNIDRFLSVLMLRAHEYKKVPAMGRSHGIHGEPISFGLKFVLWYEEMKRNRQRLEQAIEQIAVGKISGAMGTYTNIEPEVEEYVCTKLGLKAAKISTQIVQRDRHAHYFTTLAVIGSTLDKIATEIRHLQRTEVYEAEEYFSPGQKGSSAMPHKRNPVLSENVSGLSRLLRGYAVTALENVALWHERDISHSSAERVIAPDATIVLDFMLRRTTNIIENLLVYPKNAQKNIDLMRGLVFSQRVLVALTDKGISREDAYRIVQGNAMKVWEEGADFKSLLKADEKVSRALTAEELDALFDIQFYLRHVDTIYDRVFGKQKVPHK